MKRTFNFGKIDYTGCGRKRNLVLVDMEYSDDGENKLFSVCGSIKNAVGTCSICAGQCLDVIAEHVDTPLFKEIYRLWKLYHLNDMHPECEHQAKLGWREIAKKEVVLYHFQMNHEASRKRGEIKDKVIAAAASGELLLLPPDASLIMRSPPRRTGGASPILTKADRRRISEKCQNTN